VGQLEEEVDIGFFADPWGAFLVDANYLDVTDTFQVRLLLMVVRDLRACYSSIHSNP
jgi:hypothetical protein